MGAEVRKNSLWDDDPEGYAALRRDWLNTRRELFIQRVLEKVVPGSRVLEIGSGTGLLLIELAAKFPDLQFVGAEVLASYVEYSQKLQLQKGVANLQFVESAAENFSTSGELFSVILSNDMLHHVEDLTEVSAACHAVSTPDAIWLALEPNCLNPYTFLKQSLLPGEKNFFPGDFLKLSNQIGWREDRRDYLFLVPPCISDPPKLFLNLEKKFESVPFLAGGIALRLRKN